MAGRGGRTGAQEEEWGAGGGDPPAPDAGRGGMRALVEAIMDRGPQVRLAAAVGLDGRIMSGILRSSGIPLGLRREAEKLCQRAARHRRMREEFDASLGGVSYVHVERECATQLAVYHPAFTVVLTMEPEAPIGAKAAVIENVRGMMEEAAAGMEAEARRGGGGGGGMESASAQRRGRRRRRAAGAQAGTGWRQGRES